MNSVPAVFAHHVCRLNRFDDVDKLSGLFGEVARSAFKNEINLVMIIKYHLDTDTVDYGIFDDDSEFADIRSFSCLEIKVYSGNFIPSRELKRTAVKRTDATLRQWLIAPVPFVVLDVLDDSESIVCSKVLELIPEHRTFNAIRAGRDYNERLHKMIRKSNEAKRLEYLVYPAYYRKIGIKEIVELADNERLSMKHWAQEYWSSMTTCSRRERARRLPISCLVRALEDERIRKLFRTLRKNLTSDICVTVVGCLTAAAIVIADRRI